MTDLEKLIEAKTLAATTLATRDSLNLDILMKVCRYVRDLKIESVIPETSMLRLIETYRKEAESAGDSLAILNAWVRERADRAYSVGFGVGLSEFPRLSLYSGGRQDWYPIGGEASMIYQVRGAIEHFQRGETE